MLENSGAVDSTVSAGSVELAGMLGLEIVIALGLGGLHAIPL